MLLYFNIKKELLLLSRDRAGLLILFVMPMLLVLVLSLVQDDLFRASGDAATQAVFVNADQGALGAELARSLEVNGSLALVAAIEGDPVTVDQARQLVLDGAYQFAVIIPEDFSASFNAAVTTTIEAALEGKRPDRVNRAAEPQIYFDPTVRGVYRNVVLMSLQQGLLGLESRHKAEAFSRLSNQKLTRQLKEYGMPVELPQVATDWSGERLLELHEEAAFSDKYPVLPTSVQQNVPAWTLFGMFFIVIPLGGALIRERQEGTLNRLLTMPVSSCSLLLGKVLAYVMVCLLQFGLMLLVGRYILPAFGTPVLELGSAPLALLLVAFSAALAACGYGILVGVAARSYDQASTFGSVSVVIAAAAGGVMVPVYVMPRAMQAMSSFSPLGWGLNAFLDIFVRHGDLNSVVSDVIRLLLFFGTCIIAALLIFQQRRKRN